MWTQRDQLQAYQFLRRRLVSALQVADANHPVSPSRRVIACGVIGAVVMLLIAAGFGIYGLLRPGANSDWRKPGQVVIEKDSGALYVLLADNRLHPVLNYTSARLLAGGNGTATARVSAKSLRNAPRGQRVGIPGAPEAPPPVTDLLVGPWTVCSETSPDRPQANAAATVVTLGVKEGGAVPQPTDALMVREGKTRYAIVAGRRLKVPDNPTLLALGLDQITPMPVTPAWVSAVPAGPDLRLITITGAGQPGPRVGSVTTRVGQVLVVAQVNTGPRYYVVLSDGLASVSQLESVLILENSRNRPAYPDGPPKPVEVGASDIADADRSARTVTRPEYPQQVPQGRNLGGRQGALCATALPGGAAAVHYAPSVPMPASGRRMGLTGDDARLADQAYIPPGRGAVVIEQRPSGAVTGTRYLVTDQGIRFPLGGQDALKALGYGNVRPVAVPANMLALLPIGPTLDQASASTIVDDPGDDTDTASDTDQQEGR